MYPVTDTFKVAIRDSHQVLIRAEILRDDQLLATIYPEEGSVEIDSRRAQRRTCTVSLTRGGRSTIYVPELTNYADLSAGHTDYADLFADIASYSLTTLVKGYIEDISYDSLIPDSGLDVLTPYGNELRLYRGIRYRTIGIFTYQAAAAEYLTYTPPGVSYGTAQLRPGPTVTTDEYVPLGVFRITNVDLTQNPDGVSIDIDGVDRALRISNNRWIEPYQIPAGTNLGTALTGLLQDRYTDIQLRFSATTATTAQITLGLDTENDPWADAQEIAEAYGYDLYFDAEGVCVLEPVQDVAVAASVEIYAENEEAMVLNTNRSLSSDGVYNAVVVTGESSENDTPFRATAFDDNPASPTYVYGPFGLVPTFRSSSLINSQASADSYALAVLNDIRGTDESLQWTQIVDPSLDAGDVVSIINPSAKISRAIILDRLTIPLSPEGTMSAQGRTIIYSVGDTVVTAGGETVAVVPPTSGGGGGIVRIATIP